MGTGDVVIDRLKAQHRTEAREQVPIVYVEKMHDPRAAQLQILFASLDERGKKTIVALAATMARLHNDGYHG